jgi:hypothetical protein
LPNHFSLHLVFMVKWLKFILDSPNNSLSTLVCNSHFSPNILHKHPTQPQLKPKFRPLRLSSKPRLLLSQSSLLSITFKSCRSRSSRKMLWWRTFQAIQISPSSTLIAKLQHREANQTTTSLSKTPLQGNSGSIRENALSMMRALRHAFKRMSLRSLRRHLPLLLRDQDRKLLKRSQQPWWPVKTEKLCYILEFHKRN